jgi:hypothetical protein
MNEMPEMRVARFKLMVEIRQTPLQFGPEERYEIIIELRRGTAYQIYREPVMLSEDVTDIRKELGRAVERVGKRIAAGQGDALRWTEHGDFGVIERAEWPCSPLPERRP